MGKRDIYLSGVKAQLSLWATQLEDLRVKATDQMSAAYRKQLDAWKAAANAIADKLADMKNLDEQWYVIKAEVENRLRTIEAALGRAAPGNGAVPSTAAEPPAADGKHRPSA